MGSWLCVRGECVGEYVFGCDDRGKASSSYFWVVGDGCGNSIVTLPVLVHCYVCMLWD